MAAKKAAASKSSTSANRKGTKGTGAKGASAGRASSRRTKAQAAQDRVLFHEIGLIVLFVAMVLVFCCNFGIIGPMGDAVSGFLFGLLGVTAYIAPVLVFLAAAFCLANEGKSGVGRKLAAGVGLFLMLCIACDLAARQASGMEGYDFRLLYEECQEQRSGGGILGGSISYLLQQYLGVIGTVLVVLLCSVVSLILLTEKSLLGSVKRGGSRVREDMARRREEILRRRQEQEEDEEGDSGESQQEDEEAERIREEIRRRRQEQKEEAARRREESRREQEKIARRRREQARLRRWEQEEARARKAKERRLKAEEKENAKILRRERKVSGIILDTALSKPEEGAFRQDDVHEIILSEGEILQEETYAAEPMDSVERAGSMEPEGFTGREDGMEQGSSMEEESSMEAESSMGQEGSMGAEAQEPEFDFEKIPIRGIHQVTVNEEPEEERRPADSWEEGSLPGEEGWQDSGESPAASWEEGILPGEEGWQESEESPAASWEEGILPGEEGWQESEENPAGSWEEGILPGGEDWQDSEERSAGSREEGILPGEEDWQESGEDPADFGETEAEGWQEEPEQGSAVRPPAAQPSEAGQQSAASRRPEAGQQSAASRRPEAGTPRQPAPSRPIAAAPKKYVLPPLSLLAKGTAATGDSERELRETARRLQQTLETFGVGVTITEISQGPSVTRYELQPEQGVKVSKIVGLSDDIKMHLAATDIRIEAPIPGKAAVGIEVPNKENMAVALRDLLESSDFREHKSNIAFAVGKDIAGKAVVSDIARMPHMLIAGATGSGKSVCINTLIMSILYKAHPEDVKLIMVDPKVVELSIYNGIPHLLIPVVTDPKKASSALQWGVTEMEDRYRKFADLNVRKLEEYNKKLEARRQKGEENVPQKLPQIVIIVDELADLMMVCPGEVEASICRLAQLARACGIHLILATQRPSVDVITGLIKANMPSRVAFAVSSGVDSRTILDMVGAERLLGKGDMLFYPQGYPKPARVQGAFVSDQEVSDVVDFLKNQALGNTYAEDIEERIAGLGGQSGGADRQGGGGLDELFDRAGHLIIGKDKASIGMLQRAFQIGFNRAARIMDQLCQYGVVGEDEGTKPRKILMSPEQFDQMLDEIA